LKTYYFDCSSSSRYAIISKEWGYFKLHNHADNLELDFDGNTDTDILTDEYYDGARFHSIDFTEDKLADRSFEKCTFISCHFREIPLNRTVFCSCVFIECEIVLTKLNAITLNGVEFQSCKIMGVNFTDCNDFGFSPEFTKCIVNSSSFYGKSLRKRKFTGCRLIDCDFTNCDIREADYSDTTFEKVIFHNCNLEKADFRTSHGYAIDPFTNKIKKARFTLPEAQSFLSFIGVSIED